MGQREERGHVRSDGPVSRHTGRSSRTGEFEHVAKGEWRTSPERLYSKYGFRLRHAGFLCERIHDVASRGCDQHGHACWSGPGNESSSVLEGWRCCRIWNPGTRGMQTTSGSVWINLSDRPV